MASVSRSISEISPLLPIAAPQRDPSTVVVISPASSDSLVARTNSCRQRINTTAIVIGLAALTAVIASECADYALPDPQIKGIAKISAIGSAIIMAINIFVYFSSMERE